MALEWFQRVLDGREKTLGKDHPSTLTTVNSMAGVFESRGEYGKALEWFQRALDGREKTLGKDHPLTLNTVHCMAHIFESRGEHDKALEWFQRALDGREKAFGKDHPATISSAKRMACRRAYQVTTVSGIHLAEYKEVCFVLFFVVSSLMLLLWCLPSCFSLCLSFTILFLCFSWRLSCLVVFFI